MGDIISFKVTPMPLAIAAAELITSPIFAMAVSRLAQRESWPVWRAPAVKQATGKVAGFAQLSECLMREQCVAWRRRSRLLV